MKLAASLPPLVRRQRAVASVGGVGGVDVLVGRDEEPGRAACRVEHHVVLLRVHDGDDEVDDVPRRAELPGVPLGAEDGEQVLERVAQPL